MKFAKSYTLSPSKLTLNNKQRINPLENESERAIRLTNQDIIDNFNDPTKDLYKRLSEHNSLKSQLLNEIERADKPHRDLLSTLDNIAKFITSSTNNKIPIKQRKRTVYIPYSKLKKIATKPSKSSDLDHYNIKSTKPSKDSDLEHYNVRSQSVNDNKDNYQTNIDITSLTSPRRLRPRSKKSESLKKGIKSWIPISTKHS